MENSRKGWIENGVGYIPLTNGKTAKVDPELVEKLSDYIWTAVWNPHTKSFIAHRSEKKNGIWSTTKMHRFIKGVTDYHTKVDHENHDTLDNRMSNLRICSNKENLYNSRLSSANTSGHKGVSFCKLKGRWRAYINFDGKRVALGYHDSKEVAIQIRKEAAKTLHGEFVYEGEAA